MLGENGVTTALNGMAMVKDVVAEEVWELVESGVKAAVDAVLRQSTEVLTRFSEVEGKAQRNALKEQQAAHQLKMEHARAAAARQLENQKVEVEAKHADDARKAVQALAEGGQSALAEALFKIEAHEREINSLKYKVQVSHTKVTEPILGLPS